MGHFVRLLLAGKKLPDASIDLNIPEGTLSRWQANLHKYGSVVPPVCLPMGRPHCISEDDEKALLECLLQEGWMYQDEMIYWLHMERGVTVSQPTISRIIKNNWSRKRLEVLSDKRSSSARAIYLQEMCRYHAEDMIFLDESIFDQKTGWRRKGYAPMGEPARTTTDARRGKTWSMLAALSIDGYVPCSSVREGYFHREDLIRWLDEDLIPAIEHRFGEGRPMLIVMDNCSTHTNDSVKELIESRGHLLRYLPPYSPDFNPIELITEDFR
jgi:transposase